MGSKSDWNTTPFKSIEQAHQMATRLNLAPSAIVTLEGGMRTFQIKEGRATTVVAQRMAGGPVKEKKVKRGEPKPPLQDPDAPTFSDEDRFQVGPWVRIDFDCVEAALEHLLSQFVNPDNVEQLEMTLVRLDDDEYEFFESTSGKVWERVLHRKGK